MKLTSRKFIEFLATCSADFASLTNYFSRDKQYFANHNIIFPITAFDYSIFYVRIADFNNTMSFYSILYYMTMTNTLTS